MVVLLAAFVPFARAQETSSGSAEASSIDQIKKPVPWLEWGIDLRLRETYMENCIDLQTEADDNQHFFRIRTRPWVRVGPFMQDDSLKVPNGVSAYVRMTNEFRIWVQRQGQEAGNINELVVDNLYVDWQRINGLPISVRVGRQDIIYGRGWVVLNGTPLDDTRTLFHDAIKATLHLDDAKSEVDLFLMSNKGYQSRIEPLNDQGVQVSEFDAKVFGIYLKNRAKKELGVDIYYIYKDEDRTNQRWAPGGTYRNGRVVHTYGSMVTGKFADDWDYYAEGAYQWGKEGSVDRSSYGFTGEMGYTLRGVVAKPRVHVGYEYLSGDDPTTGKFTAWDPVLSRWPQWSELYFYRWAAEGGMPGAWTNLRRFNVGAEAWPMPKMCLSANYNFLWANEHTLGKVPPPYDNGMSRGQHAAGKLTYEFNKYVSGHLLAEYFHPETYYDSDRDDALFLRWQLMFKF